MVSDRKMHSLHADIFALGKTIRKQIKGMTIPKLMLRNSKLHANDAAICYFPSHDYQDSPECISWYALHHKAMVLAAYLIDLGISHQSILIMSRNRPEHFIGDLGALYSGNTPCSVYTTQTSEQIHTLLSITHSSVVIVDDSIMYREMCAAIRLSNRNIRVICIERPQRMRKHTVTWQSVMKKGADILDTFSGHILNNIKASKPCDPVCTIFTSGTTGKPKGVVLSNENVLFAAAGIEAVGTVHIPRARLLSYLPLAHVFERVVGYYGGIFSLHTLYCVWCVNDLKEALIAVRPSIFVAVPRVYEKIQQGLVTKLSDSILWPLFNCILKNGRKRNAYLQLNQKPPLHIRMIHQLYSFLLINKVRKAIGLDQCQLCLSGSAPLDPHVMEFFSTLNLDIVEGYGLTENSAPAAVSWNAAICNNMKALFQSSGMEMPHPISRKFGRVGYPMPGTKVKTDDTGLIHVSGLHVFSGYLHDAKNTKMSLVDGWLRTGDLGQIHETGEIEIVGRKKDIIILSNGKNIAPREMESMLMRHPLVAHACLVGDGKAYCVAILCMRYDGGEHRYAKAHHINCTDRNGIARDAQTHHLIEQHVDKANQHFCRPEQVKYFYLTADVWSPKTGELTPTLKLKRSFVIEQYSMQIEKIYREHNPNDHHQS